MKKSIFGILNRFCMRNLNIESRWYYPRSFDTKLTGKNLITGGYIRNKTMTTEKPRTLSDEILKLRRYLPSPDQGGTMIYFEGDYKSNRGIYVDLGAVLGKIEKHLQEFKEELKEKASNVNKTLDLHNVDECECCEKNWKCVYEILQIIDTQMQKHFGLELLKKEGVEK
jgi:hypothetical protein